MTNSIGIVGFGIVGKSVLAFLRSARCDMQQFFSLINAPYNPDLPVTITVWDGRTLAAEEQVLLQRYEAVDATGNSDLETVCARHDLIIISAGVDMRPYAAYQSRFVTELDLYTQFFKRPSIAITGTIGKTTITQLTGQLLMLDSCQTAKAQGVQLSEIRQCSHWKGCSKTRVVVAGNIGKGLLDLVPHDDNIDLSVVELSSFQLENSRSFVPHIALWSNLYPNHLDRHGDMEAYARSKARIMTQQTADDYALVGATLFEQPFFTALLPSLKSQVVVIAACYPEPERMNSMHGAGCSVVTVKDGWVIQVMPDRSEKRLLSTAQIPSVGFLENWLFALTAVYVVGKELAWFTHAELERAYHAVEQSIGANRLELCGTINGVDFYNDSKATVIQATQAALTKLDANKRPIILLIGGMSKGVDRRPLIDFLSSLLSLKEVISFGPSCPEFSQFRHYATLDEAFTYVISVAQSGDQVLFSPSGASFDLFSNYAHRGTVYKELVKAYGTRLS